MDDIQGRFATAKVYAQNLEKVTIGQIRVLCDAPFTEGLKIRVMPDAHAGKGCVIGTTMTIKDKIVPNLVGVDIGCGMETAKLEPCEPDFARLDKFIRNCVPTGKKVRKAPHEMLAATRLSELQCGDGIFGEGDRQVTRKRAENSVGSLGAGNHFIELSRDEANGDLYLVVHSGSRQPGLTVANFYQQRARQTCKGDVPKDLAWLEGEDMEAYLHDMKIMQEYADINRKAIVADILAGMGWKAGDSFATIHNYVNFNDMILRKGAVSAHAGEKLLIPFNMRDGSVICEGLGNEEWNCSAPHGAGRLMSRHDAFQNLDVDEFKRQMEGIYSTSVGKWTLDESPGAYKPEEEILAALGPTARVVNVLKPVYNFKAAS